MRFSRSLILTIVAALVAVTTSAQAQLYQATMSGPNESPTNTTTGTGFSNVYLNLAAHTFQVGVIFAGLTAPATASHIHANTAIPFSGTAIVATQTPSFTGFPAATSGTYTMIFDMTQAATWNPAFIAAHGNTVAGAEAAFVSAIQSGTAYLNIHTSTFPGGEIRGFLVAATPETGTTAGLMLIALVGLALGARRLQRAT